MALSYHSSPRDESCPVHGGSVLKLNGPDKLSSGLKSVVAGDALAARLPGYYSAPLARSLATQLLGHPDLDRYERAPDIAKVGIAYYDTIDDPVLEQTYWAQATAWNHRMRAAFWPRMSPISRVHVELDERWPAGMRLLRAADGRPAFAGLARVFHDGAQALPHVDRLDWDAPAGRFAALPHAQLAMNVYLRVPAAGGELVIWNLKPDRDRHEALRLAGSYGLDATLLPEPAVVIKPQQGEIILFDAQNVHAVHASHGGPRVTVSFFIVLAASGEAFIYS